MVTRRFARRRTVTIIDDGMEGAAVLTEGSFKVKTQITQSFGARRAVGKVSRPPNNGQFDPVDPLKFSRDTGVQNDGLPSVCLTGWRQSAASGFTLVEAMMAVGVLALITAACLSSLLVDQISVRKAKEEGIAMDFLTKYVENIKALPFTSVFAGQPINYLYDGTGGGPLITIPASNASISLTNNAYQTFYPDLVWLSNRNPALQVTMTQNNVAGALHDMEFNVKVDWDSPLSRGARQEVEVDFCRTAAVPLL
jgi:type II secretory pathway pseudopilin PulG